MISILEFARCTELARLGKQHEAVQLFLSRVSDDQGSLCERLLSAAHWAAYDIQQFELHGEPVYATGLWGGFWVAPIVWLHALIPPAPKITLPGLRALALGLIEELRDDGKISGSRIESAESGS